jgi:hypothetical protein
VPKNKKQKKQKTQVAQKYLHKNGSRLKIKQNIRMNTHVSQEMESSPSIILVCG